MKSYCSLKANLQIVRYACSDEAKWRRCGTGGRSSFSGLVVTVFGSSGFLGRYLCNRLGKIGCQMILPYRGDGEDMRSLKLTGDLGQVLFTRFHLQNEDSIRKAIRYSNVVVNLIGRDWETKKFPFCEVHVEGARRIARLCKEMNIERLIHFSALNACKCPKPHVYDSGSQFLKSKFEGELAVIEEFPQVTIFRPSDIFGQEDRFIKYFSSVFRHQGKWMPLWEAGVITEKEPVYVGDVARGVIEAIKSKKSPGQIYQAVGPARYRLSELVDWFHRIMRKTKEDWGYRRYDMNLDPIFKLRVKLHPILHYDWKHPPYDLHPERIEREAISDEICPNMPTLRDLGVCLTPIEDQAPWELRQYKAHSYYDYYDEVEAFYPPDPPKRVSVKTM